MQYSRFVISVIPRNDHNSLLSTLHNQRQQQFTAILLDFNYKENDDIHEKLNQIFTNLKSFTNPSLCIQHIFEHKKQQLFFIGFSLSAQNVVPLIHDLNGIYASYIYCQTKKQHQQWLRKKGLNKIKLFLNKTKLFQQLEDDILQCEKHSEDDDIHPLPTVSCFNEKALKNSSIRTLSKHSKEFIRFRLLIEILLTLSFERERAKKLMIDACRNYYNGNDSENNNITKFENDNVDAIRWYTSPTFCHKLTNRALGTEDVNCLYTFRFMIVEIHNQLDSLHKTRTQLLPSIIYRGTAVKAILLENLKENLNGLISMNGFVSASLNQQITNIYSGKGDPVRPGYERVLFKLPINDKIATRPYALIREFSDIPDEDEILFSAGTIWRINSINKDEEIWIIELELIKEDEDKRLIELTNYLKQQLGETSSLLTLGNFLTEIGEYEEAHCYYRRVLEGLDESDYENRSIIYNNLGCLRYETGKYMEAEVYFDHAQKCLIGNKETLSESSTEILARCSRSLRNPTTSLSPAAEETFDFITKSLTANHSLVIGKIYNNQGLVYYRTHAYSKALNKYEEARDIFEKKTRSPLDISAVYNNIAIINFKTEHYIDAKENFQKAINIGVEKLPFEHQWIKDYIQNKKLVLDYLDGNEPKRRKFR